jgi:hypothetical protein
MNSILLLFKKVVPEGKKGRPLPALGGGGVSVLSIFFE